MNKTPLQRLRAELLSRGFKPLEHGATAFDVRKDASRVTTQNVHGFLSSLEKDTVLVRLSVGVKLLARDPTGQLVWEALPHEMGRNGVFPIEWNVCLGWPVGDIDTAIRTIETEGLPWLEQRSNPTRLAAFLEKVLQDGQPVRPPVEPKVRGLFDRWLRASSGPEADLLRPPVYHELLAALYEELGDTKRSLEHMRQWLTFAGSRPETKAYEERLAGRID